MGEASFGKYRLIAELGHGGMADVFLAVMAGPTGSGFSKLTVVKRLRQNLAEEPEFVEMLVDEARIAARLNHPNVVQTNEVGSVDNQYFISMEYLDGQPLHRIQHRAMQKAEKVAAGLEPPGDAFPKECRYLVVVEALAGLHHAHELADYDGTPLEIVHRDVTPHNIFVTYEGQTKVVDFGIAKAVGRASETRQGVVKGKVRYMAPEQATGQRVDRRADVFSVGVMLWESATGRRLWKDMDDLNIVQALVGGTFMSSPRAVDPSVPEAIDAICRKALAFNVDERYATADDMRADLEQYLAESGQLVSARRKLGPAVSELFKDKRAEIKAIIEKQLAQVRARVTGPDARSLPPAQISLDSSGSLGAVRSMPTSSGAVSVPLDAHGDPPTSITDAATELYTASKQPKDKRAASRLPAYLAAGGLVVVTALFASTRLRAHADPQAPGAPGAMSSAATPENSEVHLKVTTTPAAAVLSVDGVVIATPADTKMLKDGRDHVVKVEAAGFEPHVETVKLENDIAMSVVLSPTPPTPSAKPPAASAKTASPPPRWWPPAAQPTAKPPTAPPATAPPTTAAPPASAPRQPKIILDTKEDPWKH